MGVCASSHMVVRQGGGIHMPSTTMVIDLNGGIQEFHKPIKATQVLSQYPDYFLCSSETMHINTIPSQISKDDELQLGQLYFLIPYSKAHTPLTLQDLCAFAIIASRVLSSSSSEAFQETSPFFNFVVRSHVCCRVINGNNLSIGMGSQIGSDNHQALHF